MKVIATGLARVLASPFAGVYTFLALLTLALFTGERDPMGLVLDRIFPPEATYGVSMAQLHPVAAPRATVVEPPQLLLLIRHSDSATHPVELVDSRPQAETRLDVGSIEGIVVPRTVESTAVPRSLAELSLPGHTVATVLITANRPNSSGLTLLTPTVQKKVSLHGDLIFFSHNELRNLRAVYVLVILGAALLGLTLPKFAKLGTIRSQSDRATIDSDLP